MRKFGSHIRTIGWTWLFRCWEICTYTSERVQLIYLPKNIVPLIATNNTPQINDTELLCAGTRSVWVFGTLLVGLFLSTGALAEILFCVWLSVWPAATFSVTGSIAISFLVDLEHSIIKQHTPIKEEEHSTLSTTYQWSQFRLGTSTEKPGVTKRHFVTHPLNFADNPLDWYLPSTPKAAQSAASVVGFFNRRTGFNSTPYTHQSVGFIFANSGKY